MITGCPVVPPVDEQPTRGLTRSHIRLEIRVNVNAFRPAGCVSLYNGIIAVIYFTVPALVDGYAPRFLARFRCSGSSLGSFLCRRCSSGGRSGTGRGSLLFRCSTSRAFRIIHAVLNTIIAILALFEASRSTSTGSALALSRKAFSARPTRNTNTENT